MDYSNTISVTFTVTITAASNADADAARALASTLNKAVRASLGSAVASEIAKETAGIPNAQPSVLAFHIEPTGWSVVNPIAAKNNYFSGSPDVSNT